VRTRGLVVLLLGLAVAAAGCGGSSKQTTSLLHPSADGCDHSTPPAASTRPATYKKPETVLQAGEKAAIDMVTSCGNITIQLDRTTSNPIPNSIAFLVTKHFYDGRSIFRAVPDFVLQGGDPADNGTGDPGYEVVGQVPDGYRYKIGDVAMAKTSVAPDGSAGSQFFLISGAQGAALPPQYGLLGHAADKQSLATIARLASFSTQSEKPSKPLYIWTAELVKE
jgi:cyclophilin family peptidyl-prolyl cis-trans isomerase